MALVCVGSAHGAPGATTLALLAAGCWPRPAVLVEADPAGGVLATRYGLGRSPGLAELAAVVGNRAATSMLWAAAQVLPGGLRVVVAPESGEITSGIVADVAPALAAWLRRLDDVDVVVDCGRFMSGASTLGLAGAADVVMVVVRPLADALYPAAHRVRALARQAPGAVVGLVLIGSRPYGPREVAGHLGVDVLGVVDDDARAAGLLRTGGTARALQRSALVRSVAGLVDDVAALLRPPEPRGKTRPIGRLAAAVTNRASGGDGS